MQGVGFRPFVYALATGLGLTGLVGNDLDGVFAEVDSNRRGLVNQVAALRQEMTSLLGETAALQEWAKKVAVPGHAGTTARSLAPLSDRVTELIAALRDLVGGEHDVVMESINMDLGAGD